ncbi:saccharopine dehydrogenase NADP-binding domain-containing protein [Clostridium estertheticum]|uniref:saccharopine dehydrogenase NADP-binding domain-containing protein n=1 Tax=Clostridium estertheticum TaxID=238834 RepID=UPI001C0BE9B4|nr:saccharopine dehydrogenase NADP-binding domain-containing protein [Clostridium estertheticum]MBU3186312.1 saccharopine dehydrogenase NADP-binding domain-containing protein [Clostridium estertheticum]
MIGILGGYGEIGLEAASILSQWGKHSLRIGGRNIEGAQIKLENKFPSAQWKFVDIKNSESVEKFIDGCDLIVNCVGPSYEASALVAKMALEKGCHYVDVGFNKELEMMKGVYENISAIYAAGAIPGLSGLLPRWLAKGFNKIDSLTCYTGILDKFTISAAEDYLAGVLKNNISMAAWKDGKFRSSALKRENSVELPYFSRRVNLYPYFDNETQYLAENLSLKNGEWYMAFEGEHIQSIIEEVCFQFLSDRNKAVNRLCTATALDTIGDRSYINFLIELSGTKDEYKKTKTLILQGYKPSVLTGNVVGVVARAVLEGEIESGIKCLAEVSNLERVIELLNETSAVSIFNTEDCSIRELLQIVEGEI